MKWIAVLLIGVFLWIGYNQHLNNEEVVGETMVEILEGTGCGSVEVVGVNLPLSFTFLDEKSDGEVFIATDDDYLTVSVNVTPLGGLPIASIFVGTKFFVEVSNPFELSFACGQGS